MGQNGGSAARSSRCIALVGPYLSGKTTLLEAILARTGAVTRQGQVADKNSVGDASPEARDHGMSVELNVADVTFLGDNFTFIDCPGSIEFQHEGAAGADRLRCGHRRVRARSQARAGPAADSQAARGPRHPALPVPQQDRLVRHAGARHPAHPAAGQQQAAGAAADPDLGERRRLRLRRPRAGARLRLPQAGQRRSHGDADQREGARERGALPHAGAARRLRRRADGAAAVGRAAAARQGVRRPRQGDAGGLDRAGVAGLGRERQRHPAPAEGAAPRGAVRGQHGASASSWRMPSRRRRC